MPQGRKKAPFSGKAKKQQMQAKKQRRAIVGTSGREEEEEIDNLGGRTIEKINKQPKDKGRNRYALQFFKESKEELEKRREEGRRAIERLPLERQEMGENYFPSDIDMPKRPRWDFNTSKRELDAKENRYFTEYLNQMEGRDDLSHFELNLETWRQLWRVLEMSDVILIIVDIRFPVLMFPPYLYRHARQESNKDMILILNKIDLAPAGLVLAWKEYFTTRYPDLRVLMFTSYPTYNLRGNQREEEEEERQGLIERRRKGRMRMAAEGAKQLLECCKSLVGDRVDLDCWEKKIKEEATDLEYDEEELERNVVTVAKQPTDYFEHEKFKNGVLTIGCIGTPNVGKSSLMNALMGKKVVSVSRTPGHTKHFQTIFLTKSVCLCDCPGLVFPSTVPKELQILMGSFPIAQVREPYTSVKSIAERIDLPRLLNIKHPSNEDSWSALDICDGWASKRNYVTARTARLDSYRAANSLLRMALDGKIPIFVYPPNWFVDRDKWEKHENIEIVQWIQAKGETIEEVGDDRFDSSSEDDGSATEEEGEEELPRAVNKFEALSNDD